ncbi:MAG: S1C family serine protease [Burkholderiales bacterium]
MDRYFNEQEKKNEAMNQTEDYNFSDANTPIKVRKKSKFKAYVSLVLVTSVISILITGGIIYSVFSGELQKQTALLQKPAVISTLSQTDSGNITGDTVKTSVGQDSSVTEISKKVGPSVVGIRMTVGNPQSGYTDQIAAQSEGSGIIVSQDGYIITNYHVVQYADPKSQMSKNTTLEVFLPDKRQAKATFVGGDSTNDLAVIKIDIKGLPAAELGDSSKLEVGDQVIAIGNPLGMEFAGSVTVGVVSAMNRQLDVENMNLIQTDAAINPGNSGGALVNALGQVVGINSAKISRAGIEGLGFAIPINDAKPIVDQLMIFGYVKGRPLIGISGREITEAIAQQYNIQVGIYVTDITPDSGADKAGIKAGDIIAGLDGKEVKTISELNSIKKNYKAGDTVNITIIRDGVKQDLKLTFSEER